MRLPVVVVPSSPALFPVPSPLSRVIWTWKWLNARERERAGKERPQEKGGKEDKTDLLSPSFFPSRVRSSSPPTKPSNIF